MGLALVGRSKFETSKKSIWQKKRPMETHETRNPMKLMQLYMKHHEIIIWNLVDATPPFKLKLFPISCTGPEKKKNLPDGSTPPVFSSSSVQRHQASTAMAKALARGFNVKKMDVRCWWKKIQRDLWGIYLKYTCCTKEHIYIIYVYINIKMYMQWYTCKFAYI